MIKFFRKIRYDLMEKNLPAREGTAEQAGKTGKYFKYAIGEIVLVAIGILIASFSFSTLGLAHTTNYARVHSP